VLPNRGRWFHREPAITVERAASKSERRQRNVRPRAMPCAARRARRQEPRRERGQTAGDTSLALIKLRASQAWLVPSRAPAARHELERPARRAGLRGKRAFAAANGLEAG